MAAACDWGVESGKSMNSRTLGHVPTCVHMSYRPNSVIHSQAAEVVIECDVRQMEMHTAEQLVLDPSPFRVETDR
jgi:hypothetical protein